MRELFTQFKPREGEAAALSLLAVCHDESWGIACGSLLTLPAEVATTSWRRWGQLQPPHGPSAFDPGGFDLGPIFAVDPFPGIRIVRAKLDASSWRKAVSDLLQGSLTAQLARYSFGAHSWRPPGFLTSNGNGPGSSVLLGARRPAFGIVADLEPLDLPSSDALWQLQTPPHLKPGPSLGRIGRHRTLASWPRELIGVTWPGGDDVQPSAEFVVARIENDAWIARVKPDRDQDDLIISIGWDAKRIDPFGCSLLVESEHQGVTLLSRQVKISDLPAHSIPTASADEARNHSWDRRTLDVRLPRGPRRTEWGLSLRSADGRLLDREPVAARIERIELSLHLDGSKEPATRSVVGDKRPVPTEAERQEATRVATELHDQALQAAVERRVSTVGELKDYLRWRFSARAGELLILDPYLLASNQSEVVRFLIELGRPIRGMTGSLSGSARREVGKASDLEIRRLPGKNSLHDRVWVVGETALMVGTSVNGLLKKSGDGRATTVTDLPYADAAAWRQQFEDWWKQAGR